MEVKYAESDKSADTLARLYFTRGVTPLGTMVHTTGGTNSLDWLQGGSARAGRPASIDCLIARSGVRYRIVPPGQAAYHAGIGSYRGNTGRDNVLQVLADDDVSRYFVGVELECLDDQVPTLPQVDSLAEYIVQEGQRYAWRFPYNIIGHYSTARPLGRRSDPVNFNWGQFFGRVYARAMQAKVPGLATP